MTTETMTTIDRSFVDGLFWRILALGAVLSAGTALAVSVRFGYSLALGALVSAGSLRVTAAGVQGLFESVLDGARPSAGWAMLLVAKLAALFAAVFICLVVLEAHAVAFVIGFKLILPALAWQAIRQPGHLDGSVDDVNDTERP